MADDLMTTAATILLSGGVGAGGMWLKQHLSDRKADRKLDRETTLLALKVAGILEKFANSSTSAASVISEHVNDGEEGYLIHIANLPEFPEQHERWNDLNLKVAADIIQLKDTRAAFETRLDGAFQFNDADDVQEEARILNILLAVEAWRLAESIRKRYKHGKPVTAAYWPVYLREQYAKIPKERQMLVFNSFRKPWWQFWS
ncbi:hypothetical protein [Sphingopyxis sp.]|uniref:hypothetical protein n=1 Tax=Sphingopyxis sp. TaxID=1908224 RepID=UPI001E190CB5|nr:hypothetical protein [Sphingopyxis sp.]MBW8296247.1 hypothetical protein [Sphingopyxis sp.]